MAQVSAEKLEHIGPVEYERVISAPQSNLLVRTPRPSSPKEKRTERFVHITRL